MSPTTIVQPRSRRRVLSRRTFVLGALSAPPLALLGANMAVSRYPQLQGYKNWALPSINFQEQYNQPTAAEDSAVQPVQSPKILNRRDTLEDKIAELIITDRKGIGDFFPGGIILTKQQTRKGHLFGRYHSYDPERAQSAVEDVLAKAVQNGKRVLIYDEGEGGFVTRIGTLPAAEDIGNYYTNNIIGGTLIDRVTPSTDKAVRSTQVRNLFEQYARELRNRGVDVVLGPVVDVVRNGSEDNLIKKDKRSFGYSHNATIEIARLYIDAMHKHGVKVVAKHFLGAGIPEEGDVHEDIVLQTRRIRPRYLAGQVYRRLKDTLDAVMATHIGNRQDHDRPYIMSERALNYLTQPTYANGGYRGIEFGGLVITDDIMMNGVLKYVSKQRFTQREQTLLAGCPNLEAKAAVLAIDAGAHAVIALQTNISPIIKGIAYTYNTGDAKFRDRVDTALRKYQRFAR